jgi:hypothetical protein
MTRDESLLNPIKKALDYIIAQQAPMGGWGYGVDPDSRPNTSITAWQIQALLLSKKLGIENDNQPLRKGLAWLSGNINGSGFVGYEQSGDDAQDRQTLTMMGALCLLTASDQHIPVGQPVMGRINEGLDVLSASMPSDYYASYFYSRALSIADPEAYSSSLAMAKNSITMRQLSNGISRGAWDYDDRWGTTGGQLYSTSMALLSLLENSPKDHQH